MAGPRPTFLPKQAQQVTCSVQAPQLSSRKLVERFSNPFSSSPEPSFTTATSTRPKSALHHRQDVQEVSLSPRYRAGKALPRQLRPIDADAKLFPSRSGISAFARTARPSFAAATRRAVRPTTLNLRASALSRFASTAGVGDGKVYQVIGKLWTPSPRLHCPGRVRENCVLALG